MAQRTTALETRVQTPTGKQVMVISHVTPDHMPDAQSGSTETISMVVWYPPGGGFTCVHLGDTDRGIKEEHARLCTAADDLIANAEHHRTLPTSWYYDLHQEVEALRDEDLWVTFQ